MPQRWSTILAPCGRSGVIPVPPHLSCILLDRPGVSSGPAGCTPSATRSVMSNVLDEPTPCPCSTLSRLAGRTPMPTAAPAYVTKVAETTFAPTPALFARATVIGYDDGNHTRSYPPDVARSLRTCPVMQTPILESGTERSTSSGAVWLSPLRRFAPVVPRSAPASPRQPGRQETWHPGCDNPGCSRSMCPVRQAGPHKERRSGQAEDLLPSIQQNRHFTGRRLYL